MKKLYGYIGLYITSVASFFHGIGILALQIVALGLLFEHFLAIPYEYGVLIAMGVITMYSALGGIRAVAFTDVFQFLIFVIILPIACGYISIKIGDHSNITNLLPETHLTIFLKNNASLLKFFCFIFLALLPLIEAPYCQRLLMSDKKQLMFSYNIIVLISIFFSISLLMLGVGIKILYPDVESKFALYHFIDSLPEIFTGLMITCILAIIMSSADSWLNSLSIIFTHYLY